MNAHPLGRLQRLKLQRKRKSSEEKNKEKKQHAGRAWKKLSREAIEEKEIQDELRAAIPHSSGPDRG